MDLFEEISKEKKEFPKKKTITDDFSNYHFNFYQIFAIGLFLIFFFLGIVFGNLFSTCQTYSFFYSEVCVVTEFNYSIMILVWFSGTILSIFIFAIGHIITLLKNINEKLSKFRS